MLQAERDSIQRIGKIPGVCAVSRPPFSLFQQQLGLVILNEDLGHKSC